VPATTPISKLPYPLGTDLIADGDDAIHALATGLDGSNWATLAALSPFNGIIQWARRANAVFVILNLGSTAGWAANAVIVSGMPMAARIQDPGTGLALFTGQGGGALRTVYVTAAGEIKTGEAAAGSPFWGAFSYPAANPQP